MDADLTLAVPLHLVFEISLVISIALYFYRALNSSPRRQ
ncbi:MAG: hypothetical protein ACI9FD_004196 [Gammaproteobacteria bacterium]|jgi:hypothetical protein